MPHKVPSLFVLACLAFLPVPEVLAQNNSTDSLAGFDEPGAMEKAVSHNCFGKEQAAFLEKARRDFIKKKYGLYQPVGVKKKSGTALTANAPCVDEGFEFLATGTLASVAWTAQVSDNTYMSPVLCATSAVTYSNDASQAIVAATPIADPLCGNVSHSPLGGSQVLQLNRGNFNTIPTRVRQTFSVTGSNFYYHYAYKGVLNVAGNHTCCEQPFIAFNFYDCSGNLITSASREILANNCTASNPDAASWLLSQGVYYQTPAWVMHAVDLTAHIGSCVTAEIFAMGCIHTGHEGYLYYDAVCSNTAIIPSNLFYANGGAVSSYSTCDQQPQVSALGGYGPYLWQGPPLSGINNSTLAIVSPTTSGVFTLTAGSGSTALTQTLSLTIFTLPVLPLSASSASLCGGDTATLNVSGASSYSWSTGSTAPSVTVSPLVPTLYTVTGTSSDGCTTMTSIVIQAGPFPSIFVTKLGLKDSICPGDSVSLLALGSGSVQWGNGSTISNIYVKPAVTTVYNVTVTTAIGCSSDSFLVVKVIPYPQPQITLSPDSVCAGSYAYATATGPNVTHVWWSWASISNPSFVFPQAGAVYTLFASNSLGCSAPTQTFSFGILPLPSATIVSPPYPGCTGQPYTFSVSGQNLVSYNWTSGSNGPTGTYIPQMSYLATVTVTAVNGCSVVLQTPLLYGTSPSGDVSMPVAQKFICKGEPLVLSGDHSGMNWLWWSTGDSVLSVTVKPMLNTTYTFYGRDLAGCLDSAQVTVVVSPCLEAGAPVPQNVFMIYPNPSTGKITICNAVGDLSIYSSSGQLMHHITMGNNAETKDLDLSPGVYYARCRSEVLKVVIASR